MNLLLYYWLFRSLKVAKTSFKTIRLAVFLLWIYHSGKSSFLITIYDLYFLIYQQCLYYNHGLLSILFSISPSYLCVRSGIGTGVLSECLLEFDTCSNPHSHYGWIGSFVYNYSKTWKIIILIIFDCSKQLLF